MVLLPAEDFVVKSRLVVDSPEPSVPSTGFTSFLPDTVEVPSDGTVVAFLGGWPSITPSLPDSGSVSVTTVGL